MVLVDHAAEDFPALHRRGKRHGDWLVVIGWPLLPGLVRLPIMERLLGPEHRVTLANQNNLALWTGQAGDPSGPATSTPNCCPYANGSSAPNTPAP